VVRVPSVSEEDARQLHRTREAIQQDRTRLINRLKGLMTTQGLTLSVDSNFPKRLETVQLWDGTPIPAGLKARLRRAWAHLAFLNQALDELEAERAVLPVDPKTSMGR
jgi:transposase